MPLRPIETREQRQQRLLQSKQARQAREQEIKQGLSSLPGQAAWMGGLILPSSGITDYLGLYPEPPTEPGLAGLKELANTREAMPSFGENIREKRYLDAFYQGCWNCLPSSFGIGCRDESDKRYGQNSQNR